MLCWKDNYKEILVKVIMEMNKWFYAHDEGKLRFTQRKVWLHDDYF